MYKNILSVTILTCFILLTRGGGGSPPAPNIRSVPPAPKCRDCIFFDGKPVHAHNYLISEGRCLKTAKTAWKTIDKIPVKLTRYDFVESTRINGICGPEGLLFCHKNILNISESNKKIKGNDGM